MPPKKTAPATKTPAKTTGTKAPAKGAAKAPAKTAAKPATKEAEKKAEPAPKPVTITEVPLKEIDSKIVFDKAGEVKASGKWPLVIDENSLVARFLRHRDVNMLTAPDQSDMEPEKIRRALLGAIKFGKPFVIDLMETEMFDLVVDLLDKVQQGLMDTILSKAILEQDTYFTLVKDEDGEEFQNKYNYNVEGFSFMMITSCAAPNEKLMQKSYVVKVV